MLRLCRVFSDSKWGLPPLVVDVPAEAAEEPLVRYLEAEGYRVEQPYTKGEYIGTGMRAPYCFIPFVKDLDPNDYVIRLTCDNPLLDPRLVQQLIAVYERSDPPWVVVCTRSDALNGTNRNHFPPGMDAELFRAGSFAKGMSPAYVYCGEGAGRGWERNRAGKMVAVDDVVCTLPSSVPSCPSDLNLTVDWPQDLIVCEKILAQFARVGIDVPSYAELVEMWKLRRTWLNA